MIRTYYRELISILTWPFISYCKCVCTINDVLEGLVGASGEEVPFTSLTWRGEVGGFSFGKGDCKRRIHGDGGNAEIPSAPENTELSFITYCLPLEEELEGEARCGHHLCLMLLWIPPEVTVETSLSFRHRDTVEKTLVNFIQAAHTNVIVGSSLTVSC
jgi:hypothetical protein